MAISFLTPNRTVLLISDEALYIYMTGSKETSLVEAVPWDAENFEKNVAQIIAKECGGKPVLILNDMVEQHYRKEKIPKVSVGVMDKAGMIRRKLNVAFPSYPVKASLELKDDTKDKKQAAVYLFAGIPNTPQFAKTISATKKSMASIVSFCLLPVEASDMVKALAAKIAKQKKSKAKWVVFMGQHKNGSLRQIVIKNGELALTRMTPIVDNDNDPSRWAKEVNQEFDATMSYLTRFGYQSEDSLEAIIIANPVAGEALVNAVGDEHTINTLTASDAGRLLGLNLGRLDDSRYADILHVAWNGRKNRFIMPMKAMQIDKVSRPRQIAMFGSLLLLGGIAFFAYMAFNNFTEISSMNEEIEDNERKVAQLNLQLDQEVQRKEALGFDVRLVQSSIAIHDDLMKRNKPVLNIFKNIGMALGKDLRVDKITLQEPDSYVIANILNQQNPEYVPLYKASFQITYPSTTDIDRGNTEVSELRDRLQDIMPQNKVKVLKYLKDYEYSEDIIVESGDVDKQDVQQDFVAEIEVSGMRKLETDVQP